VGLSSVLRSYRSEVPDSSACVRLDPTDGRHFPVGGQSYASLSSRNCPDVFSHDILDPSSAAGNLAYVDQDGGSGVTDYASISTDAFSGPGQYGTVVDGFALDHLRSTPDGWSGVDCGSDLGAIAQRVQDVMSWFGTPVGPCDPTDLIVGSPEASWVSSGLRLQPTSPNPFNPTTTFRVSIPTPMQVRVDVYDVSGRHRRQLLNERLDPATHVLSWDGRDDAGGPVPSGVYWVRVTTSSGFRATTRAVLMR